MVEWQRSTVAGTGAVFWRTQRCKIFFSGSGKTAPFSRPRSRGQRGQEDKKTTREGQGRTRKDRKKRRKDKWTGFGTWIPFGNPASTFSHVTRQLGYTGPLFVHWILPLSNYFFFHSSQSLNLRCFPLLSLTLPNRPRASGESPRRPSTGARRTMWCCLS